MIQSTHHKLIIIGSGPAGLTAGIYAARANLDPIIIEGSNPGGQLMGTTIVENWPGTSSIMGPQLMAAMRDHAKKTGCTFVSGDVVSCSLTKQPYTLTTSTGKQLSADALIIASGATPKRLGVPGEDAYWGKGVTTCAVCDGALYKGQPAVVVGGGDTAMEDASFMMNLTDKITIIHIGSTLSASMAMQKRILNNPKVTIIYNAQVTEIIGDGTHVQKIVYTDKTTGTQHELSTSVIFVAIGLKPNTAPFAGQITLNPYGYVIRTERMATSVPGVFAAGDVADYQYRQAITSAGTGCMAALDAERYLKTLG